MPRTTGNNNQEDPQQRNFRIFLYGGLLVMGSLAIIVSANFYLPPSLKQEIVVLLALISGGIGAIMAAIGYIKLLLFRLRQFHDHDQDHRS